jgi:hypothetical protein
MFAVLYVIPTYSFSDKELNIKESRFVLPSEENAMMYKEKLGMGVPPEWNGM